MIDVKEYIKLVLKKKQWTNKRLCEELNIIEEKIGDKKTYQQNISNYLNGQWNFGPKVLVKYESALGLPYDTLLNMVEPPKSKNGIKELEELKRKVRK